MVHPDADPGYESIPNEALPHSPGPWKLKEVDGYLAVVDAEGNEICSDQAYYPAAVTEENMRFIAVAPENAEAAEALVDLLAQLEGIGIYQPGQDEGQWADAAGLSFRRAEAVTDALRKRALDTMVGEN